MDRITGNMVIDHETSYWEWQWCKRGGYGRFWTKDLYGVQAHRVAYEAWYGPIPDQLHCLHRCDNPGCVNPTHLFLGTHGDNMADKAAKGRAARSLAKITLADALAIKQEMSIPLAHRYDRGARAARLSEQYGITKSTIYQIASGKTWR